jgi:regulator of RNase E activity RraB
MIEYYITTSDESSIKTELEMDYLDGAPQSERPWLLWAFLKMDEIDDDGFPTASETAKLKSVTDTLSETLSSEIDAINVGQKYEDGWLELYFYAPTAKKFQSTVSKVLGSDYITDTGSTKDAKWEHYLYTLYPSALMLQQVQSRHIMEELKEEGDDLTLEREVEHYLGFLTETHAKRVAEELYLHGFKEKEISYNSSEEYGNTLIVTQEHAIDTELLEELAFLLITTAEKEHGIYVGWSTGVAS